ncbi:hypothetical protein Taro_034335, partial [Colocasia esculenta]|nr:hypothetical protein [Colocasia esculenta]
SLRTKHRVLGVCPGTVCTIKVCVVFLDTLTPEVELYIRLRELGPESLKVPCKTRPSWALGPVLKVAIGTLNSFVGCQVRLLNSGRAWSSGVGRAVGVVPAASNGFPLSVLLHPWGGANALVTLKERIAHECGTVEVCVIFLDTLTPELSCTSG